MKFKMNRGIAVGLVISITLLMGCGARNALEGGGISVGIRGSAGDVIGYQFGNTAIGAIVGAAIGGTTGAFIGRHMDRQAAEMRHEIKHAKIERICEGIKIKFDSEILFEIDSSKLQPVAMVNIEILARILNKYADTYILIEGNTDNRGAYEFNQKLSKRRAQVVAEYQKGLGVADSRLFTVGFGESNPIASNETDNGRQQNRRVEVAIFANDKLRQAAENEATLTNLSELR